MSDFAQNRNLIGAARARVLAAQFQLEHLVSQAHPVGSEIRWERPRGFPQSGTVVKIVGDKLLVHNTATGRDYHIELANIYGPWEESP